MKTYFCFFFLALSFLVVAVPSSRAENVGKGYLDEANAIKEFADYLFGTNNPTPQPVPVTKQTPTASPSATPASSPKKKAS